MQLLDRYLEAMRFWLPESEQDDIINELSENIRAQVEAGKQSYGTGFRQVVGYFHDLIRAFQRAPNRSSLR